MKKLLLSLLFFSLSHCHLFAWWDIPHMAIAKIAYDNLNPTTRYKVDAYLKSCAHSLKYQDFVSAAVWADDFTPSFMLLHQCHNASKPYNPEQITLKKKLPRYDIIRTIKTCVFILEKAYFPSWMKGIALRMLIHCVGDIHQPMHCISYYNSTYFPNGDCGGTIFTIDDNTRTIHNLFDSAFHLAPHRPQRPINNEDKQVIEELVTMIQDKYPESSLPQKDICDIDTWHKEGYDIAINFAYNAIEPYSKPTDNFIDEGQMISLKRQALAGYRLAMLLNHTIK